MLYEVLKTAKLGASFAPDMYTALWAQKLARDGEVKTLSGAPPLSFKANGQPLLDYLISGNTVQNGTPTPDSPIMPQGTGERTGNLFDWNWLVNGYHLDPQTGLPTTHSMRVSILQPIDVSQLTTATISYESIDVETLYAMYSVLTTENTLIRRVISVASGSTLDLSGGDKLYIAFYNGASSGATAITKDNITNIMLNTGSTPLPYEPYGVKIPISSGNTTTNVYLGEVQSTRRIKKLVLTGEELIDYFNTAQGSLFRYTLRARTVSSEIYEYAICSHYEVVAKSQRTNYTLSGSVGTAIIEFDFIDNNYSSSTEFKAYLQQQYSAGMPVTVWYVLATPTTGIVNEPLMKIGDYADTLSKEQAGVEIPTARGTNTLDVLTDVKPSEIYIKYKS